MTFNRLATAIVFFCLAHYAFAGDVDGPWEGFSDPEILQSGMSRSYFALPVEGAAAYQGPKFWSGDYWPNKSGGINIRWSARRSPGFNTKSYKQSEVLRLKRKDLSSLAPSEKYDILMGRYDYPLKTEVAGMVSPKAQDWEGICHGWVVAALHHAEPEPKTLINRDGVEIPFGSSDIKALLSYYYAWHSGLNAPTVGRRCSFGQWTGGRENCDQDLNAGAFHIIMTNKVGLQGQGFIMDVERFEEVWNQPVVAYRSQFLGEFRPSYGSARTTAREFRIQAEVWYVNETGNFWATVHGTKNQKLASKVFQYRLELNHRDEIVGGVWESEERPDFIWHMDKKQRFEGHFVRLPELLND